MKQFLILLALAVFADVHADVQIRLKDETGGSSTFSSNGEKVRIDSGRMQGYALIDYAAGEFLMVESDNRRILRIDLNQARGGGAQVVVDVVDRGGGQKIAGYQTRKYEYSADGEACGTIYASPKLLRNGEMRMLFDAMRTLQQRSGAMLGAYAAMMTPCQRAGMQMAEAMQGRGAPLKILDPRGGTISEVLEVDTDKRLAATHYAIPAGMRVVDLDAQMEQVDSATGQMLQNMPDMTEIMQQMQGGGGQMTDETREQMQQQLQKMQEMLQQLQQQSQ